MRRYPEISWSWRISFKRRIPDSKARFQILFGIPNDLYKIPAGVRPLVISTLLSRQNIFHPILSRPANFLLKTPSTYSSSCPPPSKRVFLWSPSSFRLVNLRARAHTRFTHAQSLARYTSQAPKFTSFSNKNKI